MIAIILLALCACTLDRSDTQFGVDKRACSFLMLRLVIQLPSIDRQSLGELDFGL
jgi:hypothetical protein